ncbi:MAG: hypothetical protein JWL76_1499 [Thermoleophilia bacterium]|nr:hypothetical protein [Thermoleophilia bacterium]
MAIDPAHIRIGTARWNIPFDATAQVDPDRKREGSLTRYGRAFAASEINSSFYRHHRVSTYDRWALSVPLDFRFSVKLPKSITHDARLDVPTSVPILDQFLEEVRHLRFKLGPILVQLPPSFAFEAGVVAPFFEALRARHDGLVACEPRHPTWFDPDADALLVEHRVGRVAADPAKVPEAAETGGWPGLAYVRLHGSPRMYYSSYEDDYLDALATRLRALAAGAADDIWCIFDNTASGAALSNALDLRRLLGTDDLSDA